MYVGMYIEDCAYRYNMLQFKNFLFACINGFETPDAAILRIYITQLHVNNVIVCAIPPYKVMVM